MYTYLLQSVILINGEITVRFQHNVTVAIANLLTRGDRALSKLLVSFFLSLQEVTNRSYHNRKINLSVSILLFSVVSENEKVETDL